MYEYVCMLTGHGRGNYFIFLCYYFILRSGKLSCGIHLLIESAYLARIYHFLSHLMILFKPSQMSDGYRTFFNSVRKCLSWSDIAHASIAKTTD